MFPFLEPDTSTTPRNITTVAYTWPPVIKSLAVNGNFVTRFFLLAPRRAPLGGFARFNRVSTGRRETRELYNALCGKRDGKGPERKMQRYYFNGGRPRLVLLAGELRATAVIPDIYVKPIIARRAVINVF